MSTILCNLVKNLRKGGDTVMKTRIIVSILAVLALAAGLVPGLAYAAQEGVVPGAFTLGNMPPTISALSLYEQGSGVVSIMSPQTEYYIRVPVTDANSLDDLTTIEVTIYYDADGVYAYGEMPHAGDTQTCAIFTWNNAADSWTIDAGGGATTWSIVTANCSAPSMLATTGNFDFHFKPGKVAKWNEGPSQWHIYAIASDATDTGTRNATGYTVSWYGEIFSMTPSVHWASVSLNDSNVTADTYVSSTIIANGNYSGQIKSTSPWSINGSVNASLNAAGTPGDKEFSLKAEGMGNLSAAMQVSTVYTTFSNGGSITDDIGYIYPNNALWLTVGPTGLIPGTYTGVITYKIVLRNS
jgi:hypothetical protein